MSLGLSGTHNAPYIWSHWSPYALFSFCFVVLLPTLHLAVNFKYGIMIYGPCVFSCNMYFQKRILKYIICQSPLSFTKVNILYHFCVLIISVLGIYQSLLSINASSASLMCFIHLYFKTFPHFPVSIWISITLEYLGPSSLHSSRRWMVSSKDDSDHSTAFISDSTHIS